MPKPTEQKIKEAVARVVEEYGLDAEELPDFSDPAVVRQIDEAVYGSEEIIKILEAADRAESASKAHAYEIWIPD